MNDTRFAPLNLNPEEVAILSELLLSHRDHLLVEIRHTGQRALRDDLRKRLAILDRLLERAHLGLLVE